SEGPSFGVDMSRITDIITRARAALGDEAGKRWSTSRLLLLIDEAQKDINRHTKLLQGSATFGIMDGKYMYILPADVYELQRATYDNQPIDLVSYGTMDTWVQTLGVSNKNSPNRVHNVDYGMDFGPSLNFTWDADEGSNPAALIIDNRDVTQVRVYPIPKNTVDQAYTFENGGTVLFIGDEYTGVVTDVTDYGMNTVFGVVTSLFDPEIAEELFSSPYGVVTGI